MASVITTTFDDPDIEEKDVYNRFGNVCYKGIPFTGGILTDEESISYQDGFAEGLYELKDRQGRIIRKEHFLRGQRIKGEHFYSSGKLKYRYESENYQRWNWQGNLVSECKDGLRKEYFSNGALKMETPSETETDRAFKFYNRNSKLICTGQGSCISGKHAAPEYMWEEDELTGHYMDLLCFDNPELRDDIDYMEVEKHRMHIIWLWIEHLSNKAPLKYRTILQNLRQHPESTVRQKVEGIIRVKGLTL